VSPYYCLERIPEGATYDFTIDVLVIYTFDFATSLLLDAFDKCVALFQIGALFPGARFIRVPLFIVSIDAIHYKSEERPYHDHCEDDEDRITA
jgi:hypothetical protein